MEVYKKYVAALYRDVLGRTGDKKGIDYHATRLYEGVSSEELVSQMLTGKEYSKKLVTNLYGWFFERKPDPDGLEYWSEMVQKDSLTERDLMENMLTGKEFWRLSEKNNSVFVDNLYRKLFSREPDKKGHQHWTMKINSGELNRKQLVQQFMKGDEYRQRFVTFIYRWYFKRNPDPKGLEYWKAELEKLNERELVISFLTGKEYWKNATM